MKNFICINCGNQLRRPTMPMRCDQCGQARVGLFKVAPAGQPAGGQTPSQPASPGSIPPPPSVGSSSPPGSSSLAPPPPPPLPGGSAPTKQPESPAPNRTPEPPDESGKGFSTTITSAPPPAQGSGGSPPAVAPKPSSPRSTPPKPATPPATTSKPTPAAAPQPTPPPPREKAKSPAPPASQPSPVKPRPTDPSQSEPQPRRTDRDPPPQRPQQPAKAKPKAPAEAPRSQSKQPPSQPKKREAATPAQTGPGTLAWTYPKVIPGQDVGLSTLRNCIAIDSNRQILAAQGNRLVALAEDQEQPRELWDYTTRGQIPGSPTVGPDGNIRIHSNDGLLHCIAPHGEPVFTPVKVGEPLGAASPLVDDENHTWICSYTGGLMRVDATGNRSNQPFFRSRQKFDCTGAIHNGVMYVGGEDAFVYAISLTGSRGKNQWDHSKDRGKTEWFINTAIAMTSDGMFIVAGRDEFLYAFDDKGQQIWREHLRGQMLGSPVVDADDNIYVGVSLNKRGEEPSGKMVCVAARSHTVKWQFDAGSAIESTPVIGKDDMLYFGSNRGRIHALNLAGEPQWSCNAGSPVRSAGSISPAGRVIFGTDRGTLVGVVASSSGLASSGWPKYLKTLGQSGRSHAK